MYVRVCRLRRRFEGLPAAPFRWNLMSANMSARPGRGCTSYAGPCWENRTWSSKYAEQFLFKRWIAPVRPAIPSYLGIFGTPEFVSAAVDFCCDGAREP